MSRRRLAIDAVVIVVVVAVAFAALTWLPRLSQMQAIDLLRVGENAGTLHMGQLRVGLAGSQAPQKPWKPSAALDAEANAGFTAQSARKGNVASAGKHAGADWPLFAGPHRDNRSPQTGLLATWPDAGPPLAWISCGLGDGVSSVVVADGIVYTLGNKGSTQAVIALDAGTGKKIWATPIDWAAHLSMGDGPRSTPAVSHGKVYTLDSYGELVCLDATTGKLCWQANVVKEFGASIPSFGFTESVLVDGNRVICTPGGVHATLVAYDAQTGHLLWHVLVPGGDRAAYASPIVVDAGGLRQYVQFTATGTVGVRADDGQFLWRDDSASNSNANCSSPVSVGNLVFTSSDYGAGGSLVKIVARDSKIAAERVYHTHDMSLHHGGMTVADGLIFGSSGNGVLTCLDLATGKLKWKNRSVGKGSVLYAEGRIYLRSENGVVALVEAAGDGYRERGQFQQALGSKKPTWAYPVLAEGKLFLRDQDLLLCYDLRARK
jgi:outer membrane protein assembly factor BamB